MMPGDSSLTAALEAAGWSEDMLLSALEMSPSIATERTSCPKSDELARLDQCRRDAVGKSHPLSETENAKCALALDTMSRSVVSSSILEEIDAVQKALGNVDFNGFYENDAVEHVGGSDNRNDHIDSRFNSFSLSLMQEVFARSEGPAPTASTNFTKASISDAASTLRNDGSDAAQLVSNAELDVAYPNGYSLFPHQKEAVVKCIQNRRTILAYDMGLGKTLIGLVWAKAFCRTDASCMLIVVAPCTLMENWRREAALVGFEMPDREPLRRDAGDYRLSMIICSWAKIGSADELLHRYQKDRYVLICDEAHAMQSLRSIRTQAALALCKHARCAGCILATGTPMKNGRPANLYPLLAGIQHHIASNKTDFEKRYCDAKKTRFCAWDISGASNLEELRAVIGHRLLRKTKEECLEIAALRRVKIRALLPPEVHASYDSIVERMKSNSQGLRQILASRRVANKSSSKDSSVPHCCLEALTELRRLMSTAKTRYTAQFVRELLESKDSPIVVFVIFRESVQLLLDALRRDPCLRCHAITGELSDHKQRQAIVDQFQLGCLDVLVCTYGVGATGLTLTRSHRVVLLDRPWTPGDVMQAEDRVRRIGQVASEVFSYWVCGFPFDEKLDSMLQRKNERSTKVIEDIERKGIEFVKTSYKGDSKANRRSGNKYASEQSLANDGCTENEDPCDRNAEGWVAGPHTRLPYSRDEWNATDVTLDDDESQVATKSMIKALLNTL